MAACGFTDSYKGPRRGATLFMESNKKKDDDADSFKTDDEEEEVKEVKKVKNVTWGEKQQKAASSTDSTDLVTLLHESILNLNTKFDKFNESVSGKISAIEMNYNHLNARLDELAMDRM